jgi:DNA mismatch repair protein MutL
MSEELAAKIAAGEVVERPASVVKELVENAIDAGASRIQVELEEGGMKSIRVVDNGEGIDPSQVPLVFQRHATSKIRSFDDLSRLDTLGFRGEAMYSIAAVSRVELLTRTWDGQSGTRCTVEGGQVVESIDAGSPLGTSVRVRDLFYATPARKKFMKKPSTEQARCLEAVTRLAMVNPGIAFQVRANGRLVMNLQSVESAMDRIHLLRGEDFRNEALVVDETREGLSLRGAISPPTLSRSSSRDISWFVNGRPLRDAMLNQAVMAAYRSIMEPKRYPLAVLFLKVSGEEIDVNVHPAKLEVRFKQSGDIFRIISGILAERLAGGAGRSGVIPETSGWYRRKSRPDRDRGVQEFYPRYRVETDEKRVYIPAGPSGFRGATPDEGQDWNHREPGETRFFSNLRYLGNAVGIYLVFSADNGLVLVDQHAAHERILFEKLKAAPSGDAGVSQQLLIPEIIDMAPGSFAVLTDLLPFLRDGGFDIEPYGGNTVAVRAVPALFAGADVKRIIMDSIDEMETTGSTGRVSDESRDRLLALLACHDAVRGPQRLSDEEVAALCSDLDSFPNTRTCPHGRPLYVMIDERELERLFRRR